MSLTLVSQLRDEDPSSLMTSWTPSLDRGKGDAEQTFCTQAPVHPAGDGWTHADPEAEKHGTDRPQGALVTPGAWMPELGIRTRAQEHPVDTPPRITGDDRGLNGSLHFTPANSPPGGASRSAARPSGDPGVFKLMSTVLPNGQSPHACEFTPHENSY